MRKIAATIALILFLLSVIMFFANFAHAAVGKKHNNSLGVVQYETNPFTYFEGSVVSGEIIEPGVNVRFMPRGTYELFTQDILFCDYEDVAMKIAGKHGLLGLAYETVNHRTIQGVGCKTLVSIDEVKETRPQ